jgi:hypothetical protein
MMMRRETEGGAACPPLPLGQSALFSDRPQSGRIEFMNVGRVMCSGSVEYPLRVCESALQLRVVVKPFPFLPVANIRFMVFPVQAPQRVQRRSDKPDVSRFNEITASAPKQGASIWWNLKTAGRPDRRVGATNSPTSRLKSAEPRIVTIVSRRQRHTEKGQMR